MSSATVSRDYDRSLVKARKPQRRAASAVGLGVLVASAVSSGAAAQDSGSGRLDLEWSAPAGCPTAAEVRAGVVRLLAGRLPPGEPLQVRARVEPEPVWQVEIETGVGEQARRRLLAADSCAGLADATALIVALMIDPNLQAAPARSSPPPPGKPAPAPPATAIAAPHTPTSFNLGLLGFAELGILPSTDLGVAASLGLVRGAWRFDLQGGYGFRRDQAVNAASPTGAYGTFNYVGGSLGACRKLGAGRIEVGPCADLAFGVLSAQGHRVTQNISAKAPWLGVGLGGYLAVRAGQHLGFPLRAEVVLPLTRPDFVIDYDVAQRVYRVPAVGARATAGVELHFP